MTHRDAPRRGSVPRNLDILGNVAIVYAFCASIAAEDIPFAIVVIGLRWLAPTSNPYSTSIANEDKYATATASCLPLLAGSAPVVIIIMRTRAYQAPADERYCLSVSGAGRFVDVARDSIADDRIRPSRIEYEVLPAI